MSTKKPVVFVVVAIVFGFAAYNLYSYFELEKVAREEQAILHAQQQAEAEQRKLEQAKQAQLEAERQHQEEAERLAQAEHEKKLKALEKKLEYEKKLAENERLKKARLDEKASRRAQREKEKLEGRIKDARTLHSIENIPSHVRDVIDRSTYLYIRNNKQEFLDYEYKPKYASAAPSDPVLSSISVLSGRAVLTVDGANTLMLFSMLSQDTKAIGELIDIGIDVNSKNKMGFTPLMFASAYNTAEVIQYLIDRGANKQDVNYMDEGNALHIAARFNPKPEVFDALLENGLSLEAIAAKDMTPLILAAKFNRNIQVAEHLALTGADISAVDTAGSTAYGYATERLGRKPKLARFVFINDEYNEEALSVLAF